MNEDTGRQKFRNMGFRVTHNSKEEIVEGCNCGFNLLYPGAEASLKLMEITESKVSIRARIPPSIILFACLVKLSNSIANPSSFTVV